jgi:hypothetical protein
MSHVICVVEQGAGKIELTWPDGIGACNTYRLTEAQLELFQKPVARCREELDAMAQDYVKWVNASSDTDRKALNADLRQTCYRLAQAGNDVYKRLFPPAGGSKKIRKWLEHLRDRRDHGEVESLELRLAGDPAFPGTSCTT